MADGDFRLISSTGSIIDLNGLVESTTGVQAVAGLTGFGLPSVEVQYQTGAGDGATYRGKRFGVRDIDIPLVIMGTDRRALREQVEELATALASECTLQWDDGDDLWEIKVHRVGGGEFAYGNDTDGTYTLRTTVTLRAADPFWTGTDSETLSLSGGDFTGTHTLPEGAVGGAPSPCVVRISGPTLGFTVAPAAGRLAEGLRYTRFISQGTTVEVDMEKGTVVNAATGANLYMYLAPAPRFFSLAPGATSIYVKIDTTSPEYIAATATVYSNFVKDPHGVTASQWVVQDFDGPLNVTFGMTNGVVVNASNGNGYGEATASEAIRHRIDGLTIGREYRFSATVSVAPDGLEVPGYEFTSWLTGSLLLNPSLDGLEPAPESIWGQFDLYPGTVEVGDVLSGTFRATQNTGLIRLGVTVGTYLTTELSDGWRSFPFGLRDICVTEVLSGETFFAGDTAATPDFTYSWTGTANASTSRRVAPADKTKTAAVVDIKKKNWMVI